LRWRRRVCIVKGVDGDIVDGRTRIHVRKYDVVELPLREHRRSRKHKNRKIDGRGCCKWIAQQVGSKNGTRGVMRRRRVVRIYRYLDLASGAGRIAGVIRDEVNMDLLKQSRMSRSESITHNIVRGTTDDGIGQTIRAEPGAVTGRRN